jgi:ribosomal protein S4
MYSQPQKKTARKKALQHAVEALTTKRAQTTVVPRDYIRKVRAQLERSEVRTDVNAASICDDGLCDLWESFWDGKVGVKAPNDLV